MTIDWNQFTPWPALAGGLLIGLAAGVFALGAGRIAGISGLLAEAMHALLGRRSAGRSLSGSTAFLLGMLAAPWAWLAFAALPETRVDTGWVGLIGAGVMVGIGVRMGNGCTSGHGVCGLSRLSARSLVNVVVFMTSGIIAVAGIRVFAGA